MSESYKGFSRRHKEGLLSSISVGFFLILAGTIFVMTPNLFEETLAFFRDLDFVPVPHIGISLLGPMRPEAHLAVYSAVQQFSLIWGFFLIAMLVLRFVVRSPLRKKAEASSDIVFWFGATFMIQTLLVETTKWFEFWAVIIMLIGISLLVRALFLAAAWQGSHRHFDSISP